MFLGALFTIAKRWKEPKCPLIGERINKIISIHALEYHSGIKRNGVLMHTTLW